MAMVPPFTGFGATTRSEETPKLADAGMYQVDNMQSPLLFRRTPANGGTPTAGKGKRFDNWVMSTSPYTGQKTPPTVSMMSVRLCDENTPPHLQDVAGEAGSDGSARHFQAWLKATSSTNWTPKRSPCAVTPPAPAPSPAGTPMSISAVPASAVSPAAAEPRSRPLFDLGPASDSDSGEDENDEATTTVGADQLAAAMARMRAALGAADGAAGPRVDGKGLSLAFTSPRAPAPTPEHSRSPSAAGHEQRQVQLTANSPAIPMGRLSMSHTPGTASKAAAPRGGSSSSQQQVYTPTAAQSYLTPSCTRSDATPASAVKVVGLMIQQQGGHGHSHHRPTRLQPPPSPQQQVIELMMQDSEAAEAAACGVLGTQNAAEAGAGQHSDEERQGAAAAAVHRRMEEQQGQDDAVGGEQYWSSTYASSSESDDEIDVAELQELCGSVAAHGTPIHDIIDMLLTPELKGTSFTPAIAAGGATGAEEQQPGESVGPKVLFGDDKEWTV